MRSVTKFHKFTACIQSAAFLSFSLLTSPAQARANLRAQNTANSETAQKKLSKLIRSIEALHAEHLKASEEALKRDYARRLSDNLRELEFELRTSNEENATSMKLQKLKKRLEKELKNIARLDREDILKQEAREIAYLKKKFPQRVQPVVNDGFSEEVAEGEEAFSAPYLEAVTSPEASELLSPGKGFIMMVGIVFCVTIVLFPIGVSMMTWVADNTSDIDWN